MKLSIGERMVKRVCRGLGLDPSVGRVETVESPGAGGVLRLRAPGFQTTGFCVRGTSAERIADTVIRAYKQWDSTDVAVGEHLADQLLLPLVLAGGGRFRTLPPSSHTTTNADVLRRFFDVTIDFTTRSDATEVLVYVADEGA